jgi:transcriptional regulator with XRE-family HTH domain
MSNEVSAKTRESTQVGPRPLPIEPKVVHKASSGDSTLSQSASTNKSDDDSRLRQAVGAQLRAARMSTGISGRRLARQCGLTSGFLSQVENGRVMPSVSSLVRICSVLRIQVADVFGGLGEGGEPVRLVRRDNRLAYTYPGTGIVDEIVSSDIGRHVEVLRSVIAPGGSTGQKPYVHQAEVEVVFVIRGELTITFSDNEYRLVPGDCLTFPGRLPHKVRNLGHEESESVWTLAPATY